MKEVVREAKQEFIGETKIAYELNRLIVNLDFIRRKIFDPSKWTLTKFGKLLAKKSKTKRVIILAEMHRNNKEEVMKFLRDNGFRLIQVFFMDNPRINYTTANAFKRKMLIKIKPDKFYTASYGVYRYLRSLVKITEIVYVENPNEVLFVE